MFATLEDVKRVLRIDLVDTTNDAELTAALEAAEDYVSRKVKTRWLPGTQTIEFYNIADDGLVTIPGEGITVLSVADAYGPITDYLVEGNSVRLGFSHGGMSIHETRTFRSYYDKITVTYTSLSTVPAGIRDATALYAAEFYPVPKEEEGNIISEKLGDYSYTRSASETGGVSYRRARANELLTPYIHSSGAFVV